MTNNRTVNSVAVEGGISRIVVNEFVQTMPRLAIVSGEFRNNSGTQFTFGVDVHMLGPGLIDGPTSGLTTMFTENLIAFNGLRKTGGGTVSLTEGTVVQNGAFLIDQGTVNIAPRAGQQRVATFSTMSVGDGIGNGGDAVFSGMPSSFAGNYITINRDGILYGEELQSSNFSYGTVDVRGGMFAISDDKGSLRPTNLALSSVLHVPTNTYVPGRVRGSLSGAESLLYLPATNAGVAELVVNRTPFAPVDGRLEIGVVADHFRLTGGGVLEMTELANAAASGANQINQTSVHNGTLLLNRGDNLNLLGSTVDIGGAGHDAVIRLGLANQLNNDLSLGVGSQGSLQLNDFNDTINDLRLSGGSVTTGTGTLTLLGEKTIVTESATSSLTGKYALPATGHTFDVAGNSTLSLSGFSATGGKITKIATGTLTIGSGFSNNSTLELLAGTTNFSSGGNLNALTIGGTTVNINGGTLSANSLTFSSSGTLNSTNGAGINVANISATGNNALINAPILQTSGIVTFDVSGANTLRLASTVDSAGVIKTGTGTLALESADFSVLQLEAGRIHVKSGSHVLNSVNAFTGTEIDITSELIVNMPTAATGTLNSAVTGTGTLFITGAANDTTLGGTAANTVANTSVSNGKLRLNKSTGVDAIGGNLTISGSGEVIAQQTDQFASTSTLTMTGGKLSLGSTGQLLSTISMTGGTIEGGFLITGNSLYLANANVNVTSLAVLSGGLSVNGNSNVSVTATSSVVGLSSLSTGSELTVGDANNQVNGLTFANGLNLANNSTIVLTPDTATDKAIIDIDGPLLIGTPQFSFIANPLPTNTLVGMAGVVKIDLSGTGLLPAGEYKLIDFSNQAYGIGGVAGSVFATESNFVLIPPSIGGGSLAVNGNVLMYVVAVPEPGMLSVFSLGALALFRRVRR